MPLSAAQYVLVPPRESQAAQNVDRRALLGREHALRYAEVVNDLHLVQPLLGRGFRVGIGADVALRSKVAHGKPAVVVGGPDETVEIDLTRFHSVNPGGRVSGSATVSCSSEATGYAQ